MEAIASARRGILEPKFVSDKLQKYTSSVAKSVALVCFIFLDVMSKGHH